MAHARFCPKEIRCRMARRSCRKYTVSEIANAIIGSRLILVRFDEHSARKNDRLPETNQRRKTKC
jgi:hypothetical protein